MKLNENIDAARGRWERWFGGTLKNGPLVCVTAPLDTPREQPLVVDEPDTPAEKRTNVEYRIRAARNEMMRTWFGGDAIPSWFVNLGAGAVAAYLGSQPEIDDTTVWFHKLQDNRLEGILDRLHYDPDNRYWRTTVELTRRSLKFANGDYWISYTDLGGELDILASLRGSQDLLADLVRDPETVHRCEERICDLWLRYFRELTEIFDASGQDGYTCWMPCYCPRPWYTLQCDISVMFSPDMFAEFVVPRLIRKTQAMANAIYHWDGPGELAHLDHILSVPGISAVQYVSVPGDPPNESEHWVPYYQRIAESGKGVFLFVRDPDQVYELSRKIPAERLAFRIALPSRKEAKEFLSRFGNLTSD
jgi:hypothetical protein